MNNYFLLEQLINERTIVGYITIALVIAFVVLLAVFLFLDYKNVKTNDIRNMLFKNSQKFSKHEVTTVYSDKSKNFSGTEILPVPVKTPTKEFSYEFAGWDKNYLNENGDTVVRAIFIKKVNKFIVNFYSDDKTTLLKTVEVPYGKGADYSDLYLEKNETNEFYYKFDGWSSDVSAVYSDENVYANFKAYPKKYTYTFLDSDKKTVILQETAIYGTPIKLPTKPTPPSDNLKFSHWENYIFEMPLEEDKTFVAVYKDKFIKLNENLTTDLIEESSENVVEENSDNLINNNNDVKIDNEIKKVEILDEDTIENDVFNNDIFAEEEIQVEFDEDEEYKSAVDESDKIIDDLLNEIDDFINELDEEDTKTSENLKSDEKSSVNTNETISGRTTSGDYFDYSDDIIYEEYSEDMDYTKFYDFTEDENEDKEESELVSNENMNKPKMHIIQDSYLGQLFSENNKTETKTNTENVSNNVSSVVNKEQDKYNIDVGGVNNKTTSVQKVNQNNQPLYGLAGIMNPKMMVQNGYNMNNFKKDTVIKDKTTAKTTPVNTSVSNSYNKSNQSEKIAYNKINKTEKITYNNVDDSQDDNLDTKVFNTGSNNGGQNILFNNSNKKVNNSRSNFYNNVVKTKEIEESQVKEDTSNKAVKTSIFGAGAGAGFVTDINSYLVDKPNNVNVGNNSTKLTKISDKKENKKLNFNFSAFDDDSDDKNEVENSKLTSYESFDNEEKGELLPKISVLSTQRRTEANRKITSQNRPQSNATVQVRKNGPRVNGAIINGLMNEDDYKTVPQSSYKPNKPNNEKDDDGIMFGTILVNHKKKK